MRSLFLTVILWTWCLPQSFLGLVLFLYVKISGGLIKKSNYKNIILIQTDKLRFAGGVSLGKFIVISKGSMDRETILHEYGHTMQGYLLGPFYLIVVGLPSLSLSVLSRFSKKVEKNYFNFFPERWADKLGNSGRNKA